MYSGVIPIENPEDLIRISKVLRCPAVMTAIEDMEGAEVKAYHKCEIMKKEGRPAIRNAARVMHKDITAVGGRAFEAEHQASEAVFEHNGL